MNEESKAAKRAKELNLKYLGWGKWADQTGAVVAQSTPTGLRYISKTTPSTAPAPSAPKKSFLDKIKSRFSADKQADTETPFTPEDEQGLVDAFQHLKKSKEFRKAVVNYGKEPTADNKHKISLAAMSSMMGTPHEVYMDAIVDTLSGSKKDDHNAVKGQKVVGQYIRDLTSNLKTGLKVKGMQSAGIRAVDKNTISMEFYKRTKKENGIQVNLALKKVKGKWQMPSEVTVKSGERWKFRHTTGTPTYVNGKWEVPPPPTVDKKTIPLPFEWTGNFMSDFENVVQFLTPILDDEAEKL